MSFEAIVDDVRRATHDGRRTSNDHNSSPRANGSGELKTTSRVKVNDLCSTRDRWVAVRASPASLR